LNKLISIITPCYNSESYISSAIESVIAQSYKNWELIIIDDCSSDNSVQIIKNYLVIDNRIQFYTTNKNSGVAKARNIAIKYANGDYIAFLDSDDIWIDRKLELQLQFMLVNNYDLSFTGYHKIDTNGNIISNQINVPSKLNYGLLLKQNKIACLTAMYNSKNIGKFYFLKIGHEDFYYWLQITKKGINAYGLNLNLAAYRIRSQSLSRNKIKAAIYTWKIYRVSEKMNFFKSCYYFIFYAFGAFKKFLK